MESEFRLTKVLGFGIPYILYQTLLCLLRGIATPLVSAHLSADSQWYWEHSLYTLPEVIVPTSGVHLSQEEVSTLWSVSSD